MKEELENLLPELKERKVKGENIQQYLESLGYPQGSLDVIELSYDLQAGDDYEYYLKNTKFLYSFAQEIIEDIIPVVALDEIDSVLDCGTGEGIYFIPFLEKWDDLIYCVPERLFACDISLKRLEVFRDKFKKYGVNLLRADMRDLPYLDNSFDLVTTFHSIEPNYKDSDKILSELIRVSKKFILLIEPIYEFANEDQKRRMDELKYFRGLPAFLDNNKEVETLYIDSMTYNANLENRAHIILLKKK